MPVEKPKPEPQKLLAHWMDWEKGTVPPGQTLADLKRGGLRDLLEALSEAGEPAPESGGSTKD